MQSFFRWIGTNNVRWHPSWAYIYILINLLLMCPSFGCHQGGLEVIVEISIKTLVSWLAYDKFQWPITHIPVFGNHFALIYTQNDFSLGKISISVLSSLFAQAKMSMSFGHFVSYMILPMRANANARVDGFLIMKHICFCHALRTYHKQKKTLILGHTYLQHTSKHVNVE